MLCPKAPPPHRHSIHLGEQPALCAGLRTPHPLRPKISNAREEEETCGPGGGTVGDRATTGGEQEFEENNGVAVVS